MEISDENADLDAGSLATPTLESMELIEDLISSSSSSSDIANKFWNKCCCLMSRLLRIFIVTTIIIAVLILALLLAFKNHDGYNRIEKKIYDENNSVISNETHLTSSIRPITQLNRTESETRRLPTLNEYRQLEKNETSHKIETRPIVDIVEMTENVTQPRLPQICEDTECALSGRYLIQSMDLTVDPCKDFYQFSCGGWEGMQTDLPQTFDNFGEIDPLSLMDMEIKANVLELFQEYHIRNDAFKMAKNVYQSCINTGAIKEAGKAPLIQLLDSYGGWPIITPNWDESYFNWKKASSSLFIQLGIHIFFNITTVVDLDYKDNNIIQVTSSYVPVGPLRNLKHLIPDRLKSLDFTTESEAFQNDLNDLYTFRDKLNNIPTLSDYSQSSIKYLHDLQKLTDISSETMNWTKYLNDIFAVLNFTVHKNERIMADVNYLSQLFRLLDETSPRVVANYVLWKIVEGTIEDTDEGMDLLKDTLNNSRETFCFFQLRFMEPAIISEYVKTFFPQDQRQEIEQLISDLKTTFRETFPERELSSQISSLKALVGYPSWIDNTTLINSYYRELKVSGDGSYFQNICNVKRFSTMNHLKSLRRKRNMDDEDELFLLTSPNAFYNRLSNIMVVSLSLLRPPLYWKGGIKASNYGSIGFILGHEMGHSIVAAKLKQYREDIELISTYDDEPMTEAKKIDNQIECFIRQYDHYKIKELSKTLNGTKTFHDNIADYIGVTEAFRAYQSYITLNGAESRLPGLEQYSPEQIFFISLASSLCTKYTSMETLSKILQYDMHTVAPYRIIGALSNSEDFSKQFKCPANSRMNPVDKCSIH